MLILCFLMAANLPLVPSSGQVDRILDGYNCVPVYRAQESNSIPVNKPYLTFSSTEDLVNILRVFRYLRPCFISKNETITLDLAENRLQRKPYNIILGQIHDNFTFPKKVPIQTTKVVQYNSDLWSIKTKCFKIHNFVNQFEDILCPPNQKGEVIKASVIGYAPYLMRLPDNKGLTGTDILIGKIFARRLGFSLINEEANGWGFPANPAFTRWTGLIGNVHNGTSHFGTGHIILATTGDVNNIDAYFNAVADMIYLYHMYPRFITTKQERISPLVNVIKPFTMEVWLSVLISFIASSLFYIFISGSKNKFEHFTTILRFQFRESHHRISNVYSDKLAPNVFLGCWLMYVTFLTFSYESNLRAYLLSVDYEPMILNSKDIINQERKLYFPLGTPFPYMYMGSNDESDIKLGKIGLKENLFHGTVIGGSVTPDFENEMILHKHVGIVPGVNTFRAVYNDIVKRHKRQPFMVSSKSEAYINMATGMALSKDSPMKPYFEKIVLELIQGGLIDQFMIRQTYGWNPEPDADELSPIGLLHIFLSLITYITGVIVALVIFICEVKLKILTLFTDYFM